MSDYTHEVDNENARYWQCLEMMIHEANPRGRCKHADNHKKLPNSSILKINHELRSIKVNKG